MHRRRRHARPICNQSRDFFADALVTLFLSLSALMRSPPRYTFLRLVGEIREMVNAVRAANRERERETSDQLHF